MLGRLAVWVEDPTEDPTIEPRSEATTGQLPGSIPTGCTFVTADNTGHRVGSDSPTHGALLPKAVSGKRLVGGGFGSNRYMTASVTTVVPHEAKEFWFVLPF